MFKSQAKDLFQLQTEHIEMKVDMAVSKTIDRVLARIDDLEADLKGEMNQRFTHLEKRFNSVENRLIAVETKLGMVNETEKEIRTQFYDTQKHVRNNFIDYFFKAGWLALGAMLLYVLSEFHGLIR